MRFIHTADWHLGRTFHHASLLEDQAHVLQQLVQVARASQPEVVIIAGDIYDRAVPPTEAVDLLDQTLCELVLEANLPVIIIAGNHDSPQRLQFGARLLESRRLYVFGRPSDQVRFLQFYDEDGPVMFYAMPYAEPAVMRAYWGDDQITSHQTAYRAYAARVTRQHPAGIRSVVVGHCFVAGGEECESERPLSVGGTGEVSADCFAGFSYAALGHLHRPQTAGSDAVHYAGSLLKYSFAEAGHTKSFNLVEMDAAGRCTVDASPCWPVAMCAPWKVTWMLCFASRPNRKHLVILCGCGYWMKGHCWMRWGDCGRCIQT